MKHFFTYRKFLSLLALSAAAFLYSCQRETLEDPQAEVKLTASFDAIVPLRWNQLFLEIDRYSPGYRPPAAARMLAYTGLAAYESVVPGMPDYNSLESNYTGLVLPKVEAGQSYYWPASINAAYATMFRLFYPHINTVYLKQIDELEKEIQGSFNGAAELEELSRSIQFGKAVAQAVYNWSKTDVDGHEAFKNPRPGNYTPPATGSKGEKLWQPTFPDFTKALFPYWGRVRAFALQPADKIAKAPLQWSEDPNSKFYNQAKEIKLWVDQSTEEDKWIADFWSDDIFEQTFEPAGRLIAIANQMVADDKISLAKAAELYAKMGMALCDVGIAVWNSKYIYNVERPIQYIRRVMDPKWKTILNNPIANVTGITPEFPAYPSGHSGFGGAGTSILTDIFGNRPMTDKSHISRSESWAKPRTFNNFIEMGVEDAYSRLPLGVHFRMDCDEGLRLGYLAALRVIQLPWKK